jgi:hypothetical protein
MPAQGAPDAPPATVSQSSATGAIAQAPSPGGSAASPNGGTTTRRGSSGEDTAAAKRSPTAPPAAAAARGGQSASATGAALSSRPATSASPALDLAALEQRLRETHAIGLFTKLSLKNQVDDLLAQFRAFHHGQTPPALADLRQRFELLLLKVVTLLQDGDAQLAAAISSSREAIWAILVDPKKLAQV